METAYSLMFGNLMNLKMVIFSKAINIPLSKLKERLNEVPIDKELILYCQSGMRANRQQEFFKVKNTLIFHI